MSAKTRWITRTAVLVALLIALQWVTKPLGQQLITGSCVNAVLAFGALLCGLSSAATVALLSPIFAWILQISPQIVTVPAIMAGNLVFVVALRILAGGDEVPVWRRVAAWLIAALLKFAVLWALVKTLICTVMAPTLLEQGILKEPMLTALPATFTWPQLFTALIGGGVAILIAPLLRKVIKR
jgi:hypothetical protein